MKKLLLSFMLLSSLIAYSQTSVTNPGKRALREIILTGTGYELGLQHGKLLKKEIAEIVTKWKENTTKSMGKDANQVLKDFFNYAHFEDAIKKWTPDLYEEVRGIAAGSEQAFNDVMVLNLLDEFWVYKDNIAKHHCSGIGVPAVNGGTAYIAQNMDIESYTDGYQILLRLTKNGTQPEQLILTHPGLIALNGMNETGVGACMNTLMQLKASSSGLPVAFVVRRILRSTDKDELLNFIQTVQHASGQNYIIGIRGDVYDFEASSGKVVRFNPNNTNGTIYHTNHPLANNDVKEWFKKFDPALASSAGLQNSNSNIRLAAVTKRIKETAAISDVNIKDALRSKDDKDNPVCRAPKNGGFTFGSVIMTLTGTPNLQVTAGPPDESEYRKVSFTSSIEKIQNEVWQMEERYWKYVKEKDLHGYLTLWDEKFIGYPGNNIIGNKAHITDWLMDLYKDKTGVFSYELTRKIENVFDDIVIVLYDVTHIWTNEKNEVVKKKTYKITHTWKKSDNGWLIIGGMGANK